MYNRTLVELVLHETCLLTILMLPLCRVCNSQR